MAGLTEKQQDIRSTGIGSSEIAAIVGLSPFQSAFDVFNRKIGLTTYSDSNAMRAGRWLEDSIGKWAAHKMGWTLRRCGKTLRHKKHRWVVATPDRFITERRRRVANCEIKTTAMQDGWGDPGTDDIVDYYRVQTQWQMTVTGLEITYLPVFFFGPRDLRIYRTEHSQELSEALLEAGDDFWHNRVLKKDPPPIDGTGGCAAYLRAIHRDVEEIVIPAPKAAVEWAEQLAHAKSQMKTAEAAAAEAENHLRALVGSAKGIESSEFRYTWAMSKNSGVDYKGLASELLSMLESSSMIDEHEANELVKKFTRPGTRRGRFTPRGELKDIS